MHVPSFTQLLTLSAALAVAATTTQAATMIWGPATNINPAGGAASDLDVRTTGTLVGAFNLGGFSVPGTTINGVTFVPFAIQSTAQSITIGNFTLANTYIYGMAGANWTSSAAPFSNLSASYQNLLSSFVYSPPIGSTLTLTMAGLSMGENYEFQWWTNFSPRGTGTAIATAGNSVTLNRNTTFAEGGLGQFAIGTFTADATGSQVIVFSNPSAQPAVNGFQLRRVSSAIPEPDTVLLVLFGLALLAPALARRTRRARCM